MPRLMPNGASEQWVLDNENKVWLREKDVQEAGVAYQIADREMVMQMLGHLYPNRGKDMEYQPLAIDPETTDTDALTLSQRYQYVKSDGSTQIAQHPMFVSPELRHPSVDAALNNAIRANNSGQSIPAFSVSDEFAARDALENLLNLPPEEFADGLECTGMKTLISVCCGSDVFLNI